MYVISRESHFSLGMTKGKRYKVIKFLFKPGGWWEYGHTIINDYGNEKTCCASRFNELTFKQYVRMLNKGE